MSALGALCTALVSHTAVLATRAAPVILGDHAVLERNPSRVERFLAAKAPPLSTLRVPQPRRIVALAEPDISLREYVARMEKAEPPRVADPSHQIFMQTASANGPARAKRHKGAKRSRPADRALGLARVAAAPLAAPDPLIVSSYPRARIPIESARDITHRNLGVRTAASPYGYY